MKRAGILALLAALCPLTLFAQTPSIIVTGGKIFTNDPAKPFVEALAIRGDRIIATGTDEQILASIVGTQNVRRIKLDKHVVVPGINDAHTHPGLGPVGLVLGTGAASTFAQVSAALSAAVDESAPDIWLIGEVGGAVMLDESVTRATLDQLAPNRKVLLRSFTGHGTILSSRALQELGIENNVTDPLGGRFGRNPDGTLNGRAFEYAEYPLIRKIGELTQLQGDLTVALSSFSNEALRFGITSIQAMPFEEEKAFRQAWDATDSPIRLRHIFIPLVVPPPLPRPGPPPRGTNGLKWILDGTPIEKGAAVRTPYPDGGGTGRQNFTTITRLLRRGPETNQQLLLHAVGDAMIATVFKEMANISGINWPAERPRIEHADGLLPDLDPQARTLGVVAVLNPSHFFARTLFPPGGFSRAKSLLAANIPIAIGSDGPLNPWLNIMLAVHRRDNPTEALTREEAIAAYTLGSAFAEKQPDKGMLAPGKLADLVVLSQDVFTVPVTALPDTRSFLTMIGGKIVLEEWPPELP